MGAFQAIRCSLADTAGLGAALRPIKATASQQPTARVEDTYGGDGWTELAQLGKVPRLQGERSSTSVRSEPDAGALGHVGGAVAASASHILSCA
jgi:hypothetical protein